MLSFGFGALALCLLVTTIAYFSVRSSILNQSISNAEARAQAVGKLVNTFALRGYTSAQEEGVLAEVDAGDLTSTPCPLDASVLHMQGIWYADDAFVFPSPTGTPPTGDVLNALGTGTGTVQSIVKSKPGAAATQVVEVPPCGTYVLTGYSLPGNTASQDAQYFSLVSLDPVAHTLHLLLAALLLAGMVTVVAGMVLGRWGADRVLRPLRNVAQVASAIADGRLDSRIEAEGAGDLAVLTSSFNRMVDRLQQRIEHDARFASDVSHELRSPITTLATALSVIESRREELPERAQQALDLLSAEVRRFQAMVRDLLEISRLDAGSVDFQMSLVEVGELVRNALSATSGAAVPLEMEQSVASRKLVADKRRFERVMTNLIDNAERHGGGAVRVSVEDGGELVHIAVEDEGPGVAEAERGRIFERFARGSIAAGRRGRGGGSGLGLALVTEHVRLHGGRVWVEDRAGGGARFVIELPLLPLGEEDEAEDDAEADVAGATS